LFFFGWSRVIFDSFNLPLSGNTQLTTGVPPLMWQYGCGCDSMILWGVRFCGVGGRDDELKMIAMETIMT
jgi:hypothetical protein